MKRPSFLVIVTTCLLFAASAALADCGDELEGLVGYTIIASKTIEGYRGPGREKDDSFEGCDYDRIIIFDDGTGLRCTSYGYQYAYRPTAIIFGKRMEFQGRSVTVLKMLVEDEVYDMSALR
jgi:hypothetical protein